MKTVGEAIEKINYIQALAQSLEVFAENVPDEHMADALSDAAEQLECYIMAIRSMPLKKEVPEI